MGTYFQYKNIFIYLNSPGERTEMQIDSLLIWNVLRLQLKGTIYQEDYQNSLRWKYWEKRRKLGNIIQYI